MSSDLTRERLDAIERGADLLCAMLRFDTDGTDSSREITTGVTIGDVNANLQALIWHVADLERERDLLAETARRLTGERDTLATFARKVIESSSFRGCDADGGDVQDWAVEAGILVPVTMTARCMENPEECACAEFGFPTTCYRFTARAAAAPARTRQETQ